MTIKNGFTILELLLSITIISILTGCIIIYAETLNNKDISKNKQQFKTLIHLVKAKSSIEGQIIKISVCDDKLEINSEKTNVLNNINTDLILNDINETTSVNILETDNINIEISEDKTNQIINFYPDGSSDNAEIQLTQKDNNTNSCYVFLNEIGILNWRDNEIKSEFIDEYR